MIPVKKNCAFVRKFSCRGYLENEKNREENVNKKVCHMRSRDKSSFTNGQAITFFRIPYTNQNL